MQIYTKYILLCKTLSFINIFPACFSVFLLSIIAFDRYQRICCKVSISSKFKWEIVMFGLCMACLFALPSAVLSSNVLGTSNHSMSTIVCKMSNNFRIQYGTSFGISIICIIMLLVFLYGRIIQQIYNHFQVRNSVVRFISDIKNIQINDDATTTRTAKVSEVKDWTGLKCTFTGAHRSQRKYLRMMKKLIVLLIVITATFFLSFIYCWPLWIWFIIFIRQKENRSFDIIVYLQYRLCCQSVYPDVYRFRIQKGIKPIHN